MEIQDIFKKDIESILDKDSLIFLKNLINCKLTNLQTDILFLTNILTSKTEKILEIPNYIDLDKQNSIVSQETVIEKKPIPIISNKTVNQNQIDIFELLGDNPIFKKGAKITVEDAIYIKEKIKEIKQICATRNIVFSIEQKKLISNLLKKASDKLLKERKRNI